MSAAWLLLFAGALAAEEPAPAPVWERTAQGGAQLGASSFGILTFGARRGPLSMTLLTDTLDLRFGPEWERGRAWIGARAQLGGTAGMMMAPWTDGAPDPGRARMAFYEGLDGGGLRYLPGGLYAGGQVNARLYQLTPEGGGLSDGVTQRGILSTDALVGLWRPQVQGYARLGVDLSDVGVSPHATVELRAEGPWRLAPVVELRAGIAESQDELNLSRLGGLNPYVVPLAGAAWAEWWVEDYAALRLGPRVAVKSFEIALMSDLAAFDGQRAAGFAALGAWRQDRRFVELSVGYAPWIPRQDDVGRASVYVLGGLDWGRRPEAP